jgi:hypothetical protein
VKRTQRDNEARKTAKNWKKGKKGKGGAVRKGMER